MLYGGALHIHPQESTCLLCRVLLHLGRDVTVGSNPIPYKINA